MLNRLVLSAGLIDLLRLMAYLRATCSPKLSQSPDIRLRCARYYPLMICHYLHYSLCTQHD